MRASLPKKQNIKPLISINILYDTTYKFVEKMCDSAAAWEKVADAIPPRRIRGEGGGGGVTKKDGPLVDLRAS